MLKKMKRKAGWLLLVLFLISPKPLFATEVPASGSSSAMDATALAKETQNPVSDLISVPFQNNMGFAFGPHSYGKGNRVQDVLNIQPVVPVHLSEDWNLISRTILPVLEQPLPGSKNAQKWGIGDLNTTLFLSPAKSNGFIWGVGPILGFPTATDSEILGAQKWTAGPAAVALTMKGPWVVGGLINNQFSYAGADNRRTVNAMLFQPFVNYNFGKGTALSYSPIMNANWADHVDGQRWTVPIGGGVSQIVTVGRQPLSLAVQGYYNIMHPTYAPDWVLRTVITFLFPMKKS